MNGRLSRIATLAALTLTATVGLASSARADHHLIQIRQIHPSNGMFGGDWVELQMYADGQNLVSGKVIRTFYGDGSQHALYVIPGNVPNGQNQRTILISNLFTPAGVSADFVAPVAELRLTGQDGAVCYTE